MKCPFCSYNKNRVVDSRLTKEGDIIRRRRECLKCKARFTTYERVEIQPFVVKKDGRIEPFDRQKILDGIIKACEKRPVSIERIDEIVNNIEKSIQDSGQKEVKSSYIGKMVLDALKKEDKVAYIRFASVYQQFDSTDSFIRAVKEVEEGHSD
ncbi:MAG: transcriptional repressor NrdR [Nitrospirae bacterium]|nr:MAG: transcriptional repressor NrdR [Nitrospirota bacterium]